MSIRVLHVITGLNDGGAEAALSRLVMFDRYNEHIVVSMMDGGKYRPVLKDAGIKVYTLGMDRGKMKVAHLLLLWRIIRSESPEVVQTWMYHANLVGGVVARLAGINRVFWGIHHTSIDATHTNSRTIKLARISARISRLTTAIVCCAQKSAEVHAGLGYSFKRLTVIPNGYDLTAFSPADLAGVGSRNEIEGDRRPVLGMVARFDPIKNHNGLLEALALLKEKNKPFLFLLIGQGLDAENQEICKKIEILGLSRDVRLMGPQNDIPSVMNSIDIHVLSSLSEGFPNVLAEAMACGTPCVTTDVGDAALIVGSTGWVVRPNDPLTLAQGIEQAIAAMSDPISWTSRRAAARVRIAENYSIQRMVGMYQDMWKAAIAN